MGPSGEIEGRDSKREMVKPYSASWPEMKLRVLGCRRCNTTVYMYLDLFLDTGIKKAHHSLSLKLMFDYGLTHEGPCAYMESSMG